MIYYLNQPQTTWDDMWLTTTNLHATNTPIYDFCSAYCSVDMNIIDATVLETKNLVIL